MKKSGGTLEGRVTERGNGLAGSAESAEGARAAGSAPHDAVIGIEGVEATETLIDESVVEVISLVPEGREVVDEDGRTKYLLRGFWLDGVVSAESEIVPRWRRNASTEFPALIWFGGEHWRCNVVITAIEWGRRPGRVRLQARTRGRIRRAERARPPGSAR